MQSRYQNGIMKACQWLSVASHQLFELSIETALCDDKKKDTASLSVSPFFSGTERQLEYVVSQQNPYAFELNELADKLREKLDILIVINELDPFEVESWHLLNIFDEEENQVPFRRTYHDVVRFCYNKLTTWPEELLKIIMPDIKLLESHIHQSRMYDKEDALYERSSSIILDAIEDFGETAQGFIIARYLARAEGRIV